MYIHLGIISQLHKKFVLGEYKASCPFEEKEEREVEEKETELLAVWGLSSSLFLQCFIVPPSPYGYENT